MSTPTGRDGRIARLAVDAQLSVVDMLRELELVAVREGDVRDLDPLRAHSPEVSVLPMADHAVGRAYLLLDGVGERREVGVAVLLGDDDVPVRDRRELDSVAGERGCRDRDRHVPLLRADTGAVDDPGLGQTRPRWLDRWRRRWSRCSSEHLGGIEPSLPQELLVERLLFAPEEPH